MRRASANVADRTQNHAGVDIAPLIGPASPSSLEIAGPTKMQIISPTSKLLKTERPQLFEQEDRRAVLLSLSGF